MMVLSNAGDYDFQTCLVEVVMRMSNSSLRKKNENKWFGEMTKKNRRLFFSIKDFEPVMFHLVLFRIIFLKMNKILN